MPKKIYIGDKEGKARQVKKLYIGDENGIARKIKKGYIGDENGIARLFYLLECSDNFHISLFDKSNNHKYCVDEYEPSTCNKHGFAETAICPECNKIIAYWNSDLYELTAFGPGSGDIDWDLKARGNILPEDKTNHANTVPSQVLKNYVQSVDTLYWGGYYRDVVDLDRVADSSDATLVIYDEGRPKAICGTCSACKAYVDDILLQESSDWLYYDSSGKLCWVSNIDDMPCRSECFRLFYTDYSSPALLYKLYYGVHECDGCDLCKPTPSVCTGECSEPDWCPNDSGRVCSGCGAAGGTHTPCACGAVCLYCEPDHVCPPQDDDDDPPAECPTEGCYSCDGCGHCKLHGCQCDQEYDGTLDDEQGGNGGAGSNGEKPDDGHTCIDDGSGVCPLCGKPA